MPKPKQQPKIEVQDVPGWELFFQCQRNPVLRSQLITALMGGTPLIVERVPTALWLDLVLVATTTRECLEAEIVDDYAGLLRMTDERWRDPLFTSRVFWSIHAGRADFIVRSGGTDVDGLWEDPETAYLPGLMTAYLESPGVPEYFVEER